MKNVFSILIFLVLRIAFSHGQTADTSSCCQLVLCEGSKFKVSQAFFRTKRLKIFILDSSKFEVRIGYGGGQYFLYLGIDAGRKIKESERNKVLNVYPNAYVEGCTAKYSGSGYKGHFYLRGMEREQIRDSRVFRSRFLTKMATITRDNVTFGTRPSKILYELVIYKATTYENLEKEKESFLTKHPDIKIRANTPPPYRLFITSFDEAKLKNLQELLITEYPHSRVKKKTKVYF